MKAKFFLCMRPPVMETDDGDYVKLPQSVRSSSYTTVSSRRKRGLQHKKRVAPEKYIRQLSIKSTENSFSGTLPESKPETLCDKDSQKGQKPSIPVSFSSQKPVCQKKVNGGDESNSGVYLMVSNLFFTIFMGKVFGILICTLIMILCLYPHRKTDGNDGRRVENMVVKSPEKGSPKEYKKRVIMEGLLERKSHNNRDNNSKFLS